MKFRFSSAVLVVAVAFLLSVPAFAQLAPYSQNFECLDQDDPLALSDDGWLVFGNVFNGDGSYAYGYGPFPAPNGGEGFSAIVMGMGGVRQDLQQLSVYNDYNNADHGNGRFIEANVFQERTVGAGDVGSTWLFQFDAARGNIDGGTTALAFFKTLDPNAGFALTNFITLDMTGVPMSWNSYLLSIFIDSSLEGQILQFGFLSTATNFEGSGIFYDNVSFTNLLNQCEDDEDADDECADDDEDSDLFGDVDVIGIGNDGFTDLSQGGADTDDNSLNSDSDSGSDEPTSNRRNRRDLQPEGRSGR